MNVCLVVTEDLEHRLVDDQVVCDVRLRLLVLEKCDTRVSEGAGEAFNVLKDRVSL